MHKHINTLESVLSLRLTYIGYLLLEQSQILNGNCGNNPDESNWASVGTFRMLVWGWIQGCKQDEQTAFANNSYTFCVHFLSTTPHSHLTLSPAGVRPCCISFAVLPLNTQRPTPPAHLGKSNNLRRVCVFAHFIYEMAYLKPVLSRLGDAQLFLCFHVCRVTESCCGTLLCAQRVSVN